MKIKVFDRFVVGCKKRYQRIENKAGEFAQWLLWYMITVVIMRISEFIYHIVTNAHDKAWDSIIILAFFVILDLTINRFITDNQREEQKTH